MYFVESLSEEVIIQQFQTVAPEDEGEVVLILSGHLETIPNMPQNKQTNMQ